METRNITVCDCVHMDVQCKENDAHDISCGGPQILGYDFYVSPDANVSDIKRFLEDCIKKHNRPFIGILDSIVKDYPVNDLWTKKRMADCIANIELE